MRLKLSFITILLIFSGCGESNPKQQDRVTVVEKPSNQIVIGEERRYEQKTKQKTVRALNSTSDQSQIRSDGLSYLNFLRQKAGMITFTSEDHLNTSAYNHAHYLMINNAVGHGESSGDDGYTGSSPWERAIYAGYLHNQVSENLSTGNDSVYNSIDSLFSAIYHRFGFLSFKLDEIGIGADTSDTHPHGSAYNYNIGLSQLSTMCAGESANSGYTGVCADDSFVVTVEAYNNAMVENMNNNPSYVTWPYQHQEDSIPVFYEESPDPLPDCSVTGYPVSVQFNPQKSGQIDMQSFKLYYDNNNSEVTNVRLLDKDTDPNNRFSQYEFALYPLDRQQWGTTYRAEITYLEDSDTKHISWSYKTKSLPLPYYNVITKDSNFKIKSGQTYLLYLPPADCNDKISGYRYSYSSGLTVEGSYYDANTIKITATGDAGTIDISPHNGRDFSLTIADTDDAIYPDDGGSVIPPVQTPAHNFNADTVSDIMWRHANTGKYVFYMLDTNGQRLAYSEGETISHDWSVGGIGDFDGDGISDIMFRNESSGQYRIHLLNNGGSLKADKLGLSVSNSWTVGGTKDYNGDGIDDIMWRNRTTGKYVFYFMNNLGERGSYQEGLSVSGSWNVGGTGDFNGDGIDDIAWRHTGTGKYVFYMLDANGQRLAYTEGRVVSTDWVIGGVADFDGDGIDDIMFRNESSGQYHIHLLNSGGSLKADKPGLNVSYSWIVGGTDDYNGDGIDDIMWRNRTTGKYVFYFMNSNGERASYQEGLNVSYSWEVF